MVGLAIFAVLAPSEVGLAILAVLAPSEVVEGWMKNLVAGADVGEVEGWKRSLGSVL